MNRAKNSPAHKILSILAVMGIVCTFVCALFVNSGTAFAAGAPPGGNITDPVVRAVDIARPAVVRIITTLNGHLTVHFSATEDVTFPQKSGDSYPVQVSGTGTFITSKGDILTADHVVNPPKDAALNNYLFTLAAQDITDYMNQNGKGTVTKDQVLQQLNGGQLQSTTTFDTPSSQAFLSTDYTGPLSATDFSSLPAGVVANVDKIEKESPPDQKDVAIVHVPMTDTPSVQLGDSSNVQVQDTLTIIGFPGNADVSQKPTDILTSSVNKINVSSIKTTNSGAPVIQVGGNVEHGDSGGPALDNTGNVVGVVSFGLASGDTTSSGTSGTSFLQASNSAKDLVNALNLDTTPGKFQKLWSQAFTDYAATSAGHWHKAASEFTQLATDYPQFKAVTPYQDYAKTQAQSEPQTATATATPQATPATGNTTRTASPLPVSLPAIAWTVGAIVVILLLVIALFAVLIRPRKKKAKAPAANQSTPAAPKEVKPSSGGPLQKPPTPAPTSTKAPAKQTPPAASASAPKTPPPATPAQPSRGLPNTSQSTLLLKAWPCGHMNRPNAKFCSICGEPAPTPPTTRHVGP